jgi:hypothetical protein
MVAASARFEDLIAAVEQHRLVLEKDLGKLKLSYR